MLVSGTDPSEINMDERRHRAFPKRAGARKQRGGPLTQRGLSGSQKFSVGPRFIELPFFSPGGARLLGQIDQLSGAC